MSKLNESEKQKIKVIIADKLGIDIEKIGDESMLRNDLGADSLDVVEQVMLLEKEFDISIPDEECESDISVQRLYELVENRI